jgi:predicted O-linked N-acetylglucosamine transferase (SPINDLY family)
MDYFVSNDLYETAESPEHYSEELFQLRDLPTLAYYYRPPTPSRIRSRTELGLPATGTLYLCPQTLFKMHPDFDEILRGILERDPAGYVIVIRGRFVQWYDTLRARIERNLGEPSRRILPLKSMDGPLFMELLTMGDVMLDTPHFNGMNTSLEAFSVDLPVVTLPTRLHRGRHTRAMYLKMGIDDCIATDVNSYVNIAVRLGTEPDFNHDVRERIRARSFVLYEDVRVVREFERFFETALAARGVDV